MANHPFTIIKGGQSEPEAEPRFVGVDMRDVLYSRIQSRHMANRNKAVQAERKQKKQ